MVTKKERFEETLANVKREHRLHEWESAAVNLAWMSELYVDELQNEVKRLTAALETQRALRFQAEGLAERNAEDAALWRAHYNRTYGSKTNLWVNADGTTTPVQPSTTASAESARLASVVAKVEALADEWEREGIPCVCGHTLDTHNGLGCYERLSYEPLVKCDCKLTDNRYDGQLAAAILRTLTPDTA